MTRKQRTAIIDCLEPRRMMAVISGTTGNDTINIFASGNTTHVVLKNSQGQIIRDDITTDLAITVGAGLGNDHITVQSTRVNSSFLILGQGDNDIVENFLVDLDAVYPGAFTFDGGNGTDWLIADNRLDSMTNGFIDISLEVIRKYQTDISQSDALVGYRNIERLDFGDSNGSNRVGFISMQDQQNVLDLCIWGNNGNDVITNTHSLSPDSSSWFTSLARDNVFVDGGAGTDTLRLRNNVGGTHTIGSSTIDVSFFSLDAGPLTYTGCEAINFVSSNANETVVLNGKPSATTLHFDSGGGDDSFSAGGGDIDGNGFTLANTTITGGAGADSIEYLDGNDLPGDTYAWGASSLVKGTFGFNVTSIETRALQAANAAIAFANIINLNAFASDVVSTTITGASPCIVNVTQGSLASLVGLLNVNLGGSASNQLNINDQNFGGLANGYQVSGGFVRKNNTNQTINYSGVGQLTLNTTGVLDAVSVTGTGAGTTLVLNTNGGDDIINVGGGNLDVDFGGPVTVDGGSGANTATLSNAGDTTLESQTLNGATFIDGFSYTFNSVDSLSISGGSGGTNMTINSTAHKTTVGGGSGPDNFIVGGGDIDQNLLDGAAMGLNIHGGGGEDSIILDDLNDTNLDAYFFQNDSLSKSDNAVNWFVYWFDVEGVTLEASNAGPAGPNFSFIRVFNTATPLRINGNGGNDFVRIDDTAAPVTVHTGIGFLDALEINGDFNATPALAIIDRDDDLETLIIRAGGTLRIDAGATVLKTLDDTSPGALNILGTLDLAGGAFVSRAGGPTLDAFRSLINSGRNGGSWNGTSAAGAINSSLATASPMSDGVGYGPGSRVASTTIGIFTMGVDDTLVRYALDGDTNLSGAVDIGDLGILASNWQTTDRVWTQGDFTYDGAVDVADLGALASNWQQSLTSSAPSEAARSPRKSIRLIEQIDFN